MRDPLGLRQPAHIVRMIRLTGTHRPLGRLGGSLIPYAFPILSKLLIVLECKRIKKDFAKRRTGG